MMLESQKAAWTAEAQLEADVRAIEAYNAPILDAQPVACQVLAGAVGSDLGEARSAWARWLVDLFGYRLPGAAIDRRRADRDRAGPPGLSAPERSPVVADQLVSGPASIITPASAPGPRCARSTASARSSPSALGDQVLTQDPRAGELKYQAIVTVYHNPPNATFRVAPG